jgi:molybdenum cofactor cytidylyltransferase
VLLAGGGSSRMGTPKQLLPWEDGSLLRHACRLALATGCRPVVVVLGCGAQSCRESCDGLPVAVTVNERWERGLGSSIASGVAELERLAPDVSGVLVLLADQPAIDPSFLSHLLGRWTSGCQAIAATSYGDRAGVPAVFHRRYFPELRSLSGDRGAQELIFREAASTERFDPLNEPADVDTPAQYRRYVGAARALRLARR